MTATSLCDKKTQSLGFHQKLISGHWNASFYIVVVMALFRSKWSEENFEVGRGGYSVFWDISPPNLDIVPIV